MSNDTHVFFRKLKNIERGLPFDSICALAVEINNRIQIALGRACFGMIESHSFRVNYLVACFTQRQPLSYTILNNSPAVANQKIEGFSYPVIYHAGRNCYS